MQKVINCPCGFVLKGDSDDEVVHKAQAHAKQVHQMDLSREQALAVPLEAWNYGTLGTRGKSHSSIGPTRSDHACSECVAPSYSA